jgi:hypothetical protein
MNMGNLHLRNTKLLYKDLIKLVNIVMENPKRTATLKLIRREFEKNKNLKDEKEIMTLKNNACKAIADLYVFYVKNTITDDKQINSNKFI